MPDTADIHLKPDVLARYGLPDIAYPISGEDLMAALAGAGELPFALMLHGLQERARSGKADWKGLEPAMARLAELLAPDDDRDVIVTAGDNWWMEIGPVDLNGKLVTIQRGTDLIAAFAPREDGRLRIAVFRPLDAKSAGYFEGLGLVPHPVHGVCMRENNWEYALDASASNGQFYASLDGQAYLSFWEKGIGLNLDGTEVLEWRWQLGLVPRPPAQVVVDVGVHYSFTAPEAEVASDEPKVTIAPERRFIGCLLGGAVGDALGAPVEFMQRSEILRRFGQEGITDYAPAYGGVGRITDDTQMTLFTAEGLIRAWVRGRMRGLSSFPGVTAYAYLRWLQTQGEHPACDMDFGSGETGWLFQQPELHSRRAPGNTCLAALRATRSAGRPAKNDSKGCGGVMRVAPAGLLGWRLGWQATPKEAFQLGTDLAALTHGHPTGSLTAGVFAVLVLELTAGAALPEALPVAKALLREMPDHEETLRAIEHAEALASGNETPEVAIAKLGQGWIAEEALAISIFCALVARDFRHGIVLAVNHDGDSDSTGSITGNLLGARWGVQAIPPEWLEPLELRQVITTLAEDLYACTDWQIGEGESGGMNERIWQKYPGF